MSRIAIAPLLLSALLGAACYFVPQQQTAPAPAPPLASGGWAQPAPQYAPQPPPAPQPVVVQQPAPPPIVVQPGPVVQQGALQVVNGTGREICYLYVSAAGEDWGDDRLGDDTLPVGQGVTVWLGQNASHWDLLAEDCDHAEIADYRRQPLPADGTWIVQANGTGRVRSHGAEPGYDYGYAAAGGYEEEEEEEDEGSSGGGGGSGSYRECDISNGQVFSCGSWYQGDAVVYHDGAYRECDISNGQVFSCGSWYQGDAVVYHDGAYRLCDISNGQVFSCGSWYQGDAVVFKED